MPEAEYPGNCGYCGMGFNKRPLAIDGRLFCGLDHYSEFQKYGPYFKSTPKFTATPPPPEKPEFMLEAIKVIAREVRDSFSVGFDKALEFYRTITTPQVIPGPSGATQAISSSEEDELAPGMLDLNSLSEMRPEAQVAILARYGLEPLRPVQGEPDLTAETMQGIINQDKGEPK